MEDSSLGSVNSSNLIFIDTNIDDYQTLISGIDNANVILLDSSSNGVEQITEQLANYSQLDSIKRELGALEGRQATTAWLTLSAHKRVRASKEPRLSQ